MALNGQSSQMPRANVELKARISSCQALRPVAQKLATARLADERQVDTYFRCPHGRIKLRQINGQTGQLIWYSRPDVERPSVDAAAAGSAANPAEEDRRPFATSRYLITPIEHPEELKIALGNAWGIRQVVDKEREIYLYHNVRIHLDRVHRLGEFLEFEAVLDGVDEATGQQQLAGLRVEFGIRPEQRVEGSYVDLLEAIAG